MFLLSSIFVPRGWGGGQEWGGLGIPLQKGRWCSSEILKRAPESYQDPVLWAWLRGTNFKISTVTFFRLNTLVPQKPTTVDLRGTKTVFFTGFKR